MKIGDIVYVVDWGYHYDKFFNWVDNKKIYFLNWKTDIPDYCGIDHHWDYKYTPKLTVKGEPFKDGSRTLVSKTPIYKNYKYEILEITTHPKAGEYTQTQEVRDHWKDKGGMDDKYTTNPIYLLASTHTKDDWNRCYIQIEESGLSLLTPEQHADKEFNALKEAHKGKYSVDDRKSGEVKGFPKEFIKSVYDTNDDVLFGSSYTKGKVHYDYMEGYFTKDGVPFIISVGIKYDGKGNSDLPEDAIKMPFNQLPSMFPNNTFK